MKSSKLKLFAARFSQHTIISFTGFAIIALLWCSVGILISIGYQNEVYDTYRENKNLAKAFEEHVRRTFISADNQLLVVKEEYERESSVSPSLKTFLGQATADPAIIQIRIVDSNGNDVASKNLLARTSVNLADREFFQIVRDSANKGLLIEKPVMGEATGKSAIHLAYRMNNSDGSFKGAVVAAVAVDYFGQFYREMELGEGKLFALAHLDGIMLCRVENETWSSGQDVSKGEIYQYVKQKPIDSMLVTSSIDGRQRFYSYRVLPDYPLIVLVGIREDQALAAFYRRSIIFLVFTILASLGILIAGYIILGHRERELASQKKTLRMERLASLGTLAAGVAHEINQPLQALKVTADGALYCLDNGKSVETEQTKENYRRISRSTNRISAIVKRLRDFVHRSQSADMAAVNLNDAEKGAVELLGERLKSHTITLRELLSSDPAVIWGNSGRLQEIYINLMVNALHALDTADRENKEIVITTECKMDKVVLEIFNNGPPIPQDIIEKIYDPFFSTKTTNGENMGLGLSIVQSIVSEHGGHIAAINHDDGVSFRIEFPRYSGS